MMVVTLAPGRLSRSPHRPVIEARGGAKPAGAGEAQLSAGPGATATNPPIGIRIVVFSLSRVGSPAARVVCFALLDVTVVRSSVQ